MAILWVRPCVWVVASARTSRLKRIALMQNIKRIDFMGLLLVESLHRLSVSEEGDKVSRLTEVRNDVPLMY